MLLAYSLVVLFLLALPPVLAAAFRQRYRVPWFVFLTGVATFLGSQVVHLPLNSLLEHAGILPSAPYGRDVLLRAVLVLGLTSGLCEESAGRWGSGSCAGSAGCRMASCWAWGTAASRP